MAHTLECLCEEHVAALQQLVMLSQIQDQMLDQMSDILKIGVGIREDMDRLKRDQRTDGDLGHNGDNV